jgi:hypothetical protein
MKEGKVRILPPRCWGFRIEMEIEMEIETLEGTMRASPGDYVIRGVNGEIYPCKADIFEMTYEEVV